METHKLKRAQLFQNSGGDVARETLIGCGQTVPQSGIYEAIHHLHDEDGSADGAIIALRGEVVRPCLNCGDHVCLRLIYAAPHISEDEDFTSEPMVSN